MLKKKKGNLGPLLLPERKTASAYRALKNIMRIKRSEQEEEYAR